MVKSKDTTTGGQSVPNKKDWVRVSSFWIIGVCITMLLALLGLMAWRATTNNPEVYRVIVTSYSMPDSLKSCNYLTYEQVDSLISAVRDYDLQLTQKYQYLVEQKEQDSQIFYWGSLIVGIVVAVFGWFGFQSFTTIEDKAKSKAVNVAKRTAWTETTKFLNEEGKKQINQAATEILQEDAVKKVKEHVLNDLNTTIEERIKLYVPKYDELNNKVDHIEASLKPTIDKAVKDAVDDIMAKYKKPRKEVSKEKEEEK